MGAKAQVTYEVSKITTGITFCNACGGTGSVTGRGSRGIVRQCTTCGGKGKTKITHATTVELIEALRDLKLIQ